MKRKLIAVIVIALMLTFGAQATYAADKSSLDRVDIEVTVNIDGSAHIKEVWNAQIYNGSEASKSLSHLNGAKVSNFKVTNEVGKEYRVVTPWDSAKTRLDKFTSCGTSERMSGDITLYWGLGDYGERAYILEYDITGFVKKCKDGNFTYFTFIQPGMQPVPNKVTVSVIAPSEISIADIKLSSYGFEGTTRTDGDTNKILVETDDRKFNANSYMVILAGFEEGKFNCELSSSKSFEDIFNEAEEGKGLGVVTQSISLVDIGIRLLVVIAFVLGILYIMSCIKLSKRLKNTTGLPVKLIFDKSAKRIKPLEESNPIDIIKDGNNVQMFYEVYTIGVTYGLVKNIYSIFGALIVKWITTEVLVVNTDEEKIDTFTFEFTNRQPDINNHFEFELYKMLKEAANDGLIAPKDLEKWFRDNHERFTGWTNEILVNTCESLALKGLCDAVPMSTRVQRKITFKEYSTREMLSEVAQSIQGFKKYILEFGKHYEPKGNKSIDQYMVYAQLFNLTNVFVDQLDGLPDKGDAWECLHSKLGKKQTDRIIMAINQIMSLTTVRLSYSKREAEIEAKKEALKSKLGIK